mgnify:CR=1 FL=1
MNKTTIAVLTAIFTVSCAGPFNLPSNFGESLYSPQLIETQSFVEVILEGESVDTVDITIAGDNFYEENVTLDPTKSYTRTYTRAYYSDQTRPALVVQVDIQSSTEVVYEVLVDGQVQSSGVTDGTGTVDYTYSDNTQAPQPMVKRFPVAFKMYLANPAVPEHAQCPETDSLVITWDGVPITIPQQQSWYSIDHIFNYYEPYMSNEPEPTEISYNENFMIGMTMRENLGQPATDSGVFIEIEYNGAVQEWAGVFYDGGYATIAPHAIGQ